MKESNLKLIGIPRIVESFFKLDKKYDLSEKNDTEIKLNMETEIDGNENDDSLFLCRIKLNVTNESKEFEIKLTVEGIFKIDEEKDEFKKVLLTNGPAILISFARPYIVNLTTSAGMEPIVLPLLNLKK